MCVREGGRSSAGGRAHLDAQIELLEAVRQLTEVDVPIPVGVDEVHQPLALRLGELALKLLDALNEFLGVELAVAILVHCVWVLGTGGGCVGDGGNPWEGVGGVRGGKGVRGGGTWDVA